MTTLERRHEEVCRELRSMAGSMRLLAVMASVVAALLLAHLAVFVRWLATLQGSLP